MTRETEPEFNRADAPIQSIQNDILDRDTFAIDIANSIRNWSSSESLVIGISGRWGEGKTSVLNMVKEALKQDIESLDDLSDQGTSSSLDSTGDRTEGIQILEFQPWQFTGIETIARSFFQDLAQKVGDGNENSNNEELRRKVELWGSALNRIGGVKPSGGLTQRTKVAFLILGVFLLLGTGKRLAEVIAGLFGVDIGSVPNGLLIPMLVVASLIGVAAIVAPFVNQTAEYLQSREESEQKTTSDLRSEIEEELIERDHALVVLIDDVDRLTIEEVELLFQLVRSSASFPNVVYVLGLDVNRIREKLNEKGIEKDHLDKIIQATYDLPEISEGKIKEYAENRLLSEEILNSDAVRRSFSAQKGRWDAVFEIASDAYFDTLRDVNRFLSSFQLQVGRFTQHDSFEANAVDLFALHILREFERPVFQNLLENRKLFCQAPGTVVDMEALMEYEEERGGREAPTSEREEGLEEVLSKTEDDKTVRVILARLFPYAAKYLFEQGKSNNPDHTDWVLERRVAHPFYFRSYFEQRPAERPLSRREEENLRDLLHDPKKLRDKLEEWSRDDRLLEGLHFIMAFVQEGILKKLERKSIVQALSPLEKLLLNKDQGLEQSDGLDSLEEPNVPSEAAEDTICEILRRAESESEKGELIESLLVSPPAFHFARSAIQLVRDEVDLPDKRLKSLRKKYARKVEEKVESATIKARNTIYDRDDFAEIIFLWFEWGDAEKATDWLEKQIEEGNLLSIASQFLAEEERSGNNLSRNTEFEPKLLKLLDGSLSTRDLRKKALGAISKVSTEGVYQFSERPERLNALKELIKD